MQDKGLARASADPKGMVYLTFLRRPSAADLDRSYPRDVSGEVYVNLDCARLDHGRLRDCRVREAAPDTASVRRMALFLATAYRAAPSAADNQAPGPANIWLSMELSNGLPPNDNSFRCLPVFCFEELLQPPPPPPARGR